MRFCYIAKRSKIDFVFGNLWATKKKNVEEKEEEEAVNEFVCFCFVVRLI